MNIGAKFYRVEQSEKDHRRAILCGATSCEYATGRLSSIVENMVANHWRHTDDINIKKLSTVVMLTNGERVVTLAVVECTVDDLIETRRELAEMPWLTRANGVQVYDVSADEDTRELAIGGETPTDAIMDWLADGSDDYANEQEGTGV